MPIVRKQPYHKTATQFLTALVRYQSAIVHTSASGMSVDIDERRYSVCPNTGKIMCEHIDEHGRVYDRYTLDHLHTTTEV